MPTIRLSKAIVDGKLQVYIGTNEGKVTLQLHGHDGPGISMESWDARRLGNELLDEARYCDQLSCWNGDEKETTRPVGLPDDEVEND